jgi:hypothetical protein
LESTAPSYTRPLHGPKGSQSAGIHAIGVLSGNRTSSIVALAILGAFAAADAGRAREDGTGAMWVAPELLGALETVRFSDCNHEVVIKTDLLTNGRVVFEWQPATGELSFAPATNDKTHAPESATRDCE